MKHPTTNIITAVFDESPNPSDQILNPGPNKLTPSGLVMDNQSRYHSSLDVPWDQDKNHINHWGIHYIMIYDDTHGKQNNL